jgi:mRNA interferase MazF
VLGRLSRSYIPDVGDVVWIEFSPQVGHEQIGRRPGVVLSPQIYNEKAGLAIICPVTSQVKGYPFEVVLPAKLQVRGVILADQIRSLDWRQRRVQKFGKLSSAVLDEVRQRIAAVIGLA